MSIFPYASATGKGPVRCRAMQQGSRAAVQSLAEFSTTVLTPSVLEWHAEVRAVNDLLMYTG